MKLSIWQRIVRRLTEYYREASFWTRTRIYLALYAHDAVRELRSLNRRGVFVDCGSNLGQGFKFFSQSFKPNYFDYELFEPNPYCQEHLQRLRSERPGFSMLIHPKAASVQNGRVKFYGLSEPQGFGKLSEGGSILKEHDSIYYQASEELAIEVEAIDFCEYILELSSRYPLIAMKIDIEGAEYELLEKLLDSGLLGRIHSLYLEFHSQYMEPGLRDKYRLWEKQLENRIRRTGCKLLLWR